MFKTFTIISACVILSGCSFLRDFVKPVEVTTTAQDKTPLNIPSPDPLKAPNIKWIVVTPENVDEVFARLAQSGQDVVLFAITPDGYENLSMSMAEIRNLINSQRNIIIKYKEYYEPVKK